jgi:hypothetical protein
LFAKKEEFNMKKSNKASMAYEINKKMRRSWDMNPVTRIKEDNRRNKKRRRQNEKKEVMRFNINGFN